MADIRMVLSKNKPPKNVSNGDGTMPMIFSSSNNDTSIRTGITSGKDSRFIARL